MVEFQDVLDFVDKIEAGYELAQDVIGTAENIINGTRCVHGETVPVTGWLKDIPSWVDLCDPPGSIMVSGGWRLGIQTPEAWKAIAELDPIVGIAPRGTMFGDLTSEQQREYMSAAAAIGVAQHVGDIKKFAPLWNDLTATQRTLGWVSPEVSSSWDRERKFPADTTGFDPVDGTALFITAIDVESSLGRLSSPDIKLVPLQSAEYGAAAMTVHSGTAPTNADLQACLTLDYSQRSKCVADTLKANPELAALYAATQDPWKEVADPAKMIQGVRGLNNRHYTVVKIGSKQYGIRTAYVAGTVAVGGTAAATAVSAAAFYLFGTKKGKKNRKKWFKF